MVEQVRADPRVDAERVVLWFFSGGGLFAADWLRSAPPWLRGIALAYPLLLPFPGWEVDTRFLPVEALASGGDVPLVLARAGQDPRSWPASTRSSRRRPRRAGRCG
ncbi:hypothetical protein [Micromonospora sp. NBC_01638]|uniref:hypothetical protein n=1 Tax=Micromonospora sp. NBC_01638 TaxID=2975982 RepID=UPI003869A046|nr:hypothetical protein OG811_01070 [Micromonospora sp. NBC_01638]